MRLMKGALAPNSKILYRKHYVIFLQFVEEYFPETRNITEEIWIMFVAYLHREKEWCYSTIVPALSAISFVLKMTGRHSEDYSKSFTVRTLLRAIGNLHQTRDAREPITLHVLEKLVVVTKRHPYDVILFAAMYSMMFFALLRIGEVCTTSGKNSNVIQRDQVQISQDGESITLKLIQFKHSKGDPVFIVLTKHAGKSFCPVANMHRYLACRGEAVGSLFIEGNGRPVSRHKFVGNFQRDLLAIGSSCRILKSHSFRIGGACYAAECGFSDAQIRRLGRWRSNAFMKYLRAFSVKH